jgi:glucose-fructose oxidoreductase
MAVTERECEAMIRAADRAGVKLMIAYRLHFERANLKAVEAVRAGKLGEPRIFHSVFANRVTDEGNIRLGPIAKGGGTLYDIGIYCLNAARYLFRSEPEEVFAVSTRGRDRRFDEADEMTSCVLRFPEDRLATFTASFAAADHDFYEVLGTKGSLRLEPAYSLDDPLGLRLETGGRRRERQYPKRDQVAPELLYFSDCVIRGRTPEPSGREGLADVRVIRALYRSAARGRPVRLAPFRKAARPDLRQESYRPPVGKQELIEAEAPSPE